MNMKEHFKVMLMTFALATVVVVITACTNPRPTASPDSQDSNSGFCETYKMQEIDVSDSNDERLKKLRENTFFQGKCS